MLPFALLSGAKKGIVKLNTFSENRLDGMMNYIIKNYVDTYEGKLMDGKGRCKEKEGRSEELEG